MEGLPRLCSGGAVEVVLWGSFRGGVGGLPRWCCGGAVEVVLWGGFRGDVVLGLPRWCCRGAAEMVRWRSAKVVLWGGVLSRFCWAAISGVGGCLAERDDRKV